MQYVYYYKKYVKLFTAAHLIFDSSMRILVTWHQMVWAPTDENFLLN